MSNKNEDEYRRRICRAIDFINENLASNPSVAEIARAAPFSRFHFQRLFRALVGETVADFTRRVRLETAARRLKFRTDEEITRLAHELGYSSSQNFAKAFKKHFGVSPSQFRDEQLPATDDHDELAYRVELNERIEVTIQEVDEFRVVYRRHFGDYNDPGVQQAFDSLVKWAAPRGLDVFEDYLGIPWDDSDITPDAHCRFDACLQVDDAVQLSGGINWQTIPKGQYAIYRCEVFHHDFDKPWTDLIRNWLPGSGYQPADRPRVERYYSDGRSDPSGRWNVAVWLPVRPL